MPGRCRTETLVHVQVCDPCAASPASLRVIRAGRCSWCPWGQHHSPWLRGERTKKTEPGSAEKHSGRLRGQWSHTGKWEVLAGRKGEKKSQDDQALGQELAIIGGALKKV